MKILFVTSQVLRNHPDFAEGANLPRDVPSTEPTFRFVKHSSKRTVIVLDTSGSMTHNNKLYKLAQVGKAGGIMTRRNKL